MEARAMDQENQSLMNILKSLDLDDSTEVYIFKIVDIDS